MKKTPCIKEFNLVHKNHEIKVFFREHFLNYCFFTQRPYFKTYTFFISFLYWFVKLSKFHILLSQLVVIIFPQTFRFSHSFDSIGVYCIYFSHASFSCLLYLKFSVIHAFIPPPSPPPPPPPSFWLNSVTRCNNVENATPDSHFNSSRPLFLLQFL